LAGTFLPKWRNTNEIPSPGKDLHFPGSTMRTLERDDTCTVQRKAQIHNKN